MLEHLADKDVYIYGCGAGCVIVSVFLDEVYGAVPKAAVVTDGRKHAGEITTPSGHRFPVMELSAFKQTAKVDGRSYMLNTVTTDTDDIRSVIASCGFSDSQQEVIDGAVCNELFGELLRRLISVDRSASWCVCAPTHGPFSSRDAASIMYDFGFPAPTVLVVPDGSLNESETQLITPDGPRVDVVEVSQFLAHQNADLFVDICSPDGDRSIASLLNDHAYSGQYINISRLVELIEKTSKVVFAQHFRDRLKEIGVDVEDEVLRFNDVSFYNPGHRRLDGSADMTARGLVTWTVFDDVVPRVTKRYDLTHEGPYELDAVCCESGDVVVDAGANYGTFTCWAASRGCEVYAFEPDETNIAVLKKQQELYPGRITIVPKALSDKTETLSFFRSNVSTESTIFATRADGLLETKVEAASIDDLVRDGVLPRVDFIKADIEGAERLMLEGAREAIAKFKPKIAVCIYHRPDDREVLTRIIKEACPEYEVEYRWKKLYAHVPK